MKTIELLIGNGTAWLHVPDGWDVFVFRGVRYVKDATGKFVGDVQPERTVDGGTDRIEGITAF